MDQLLKNQCEVQLHDPTWLYESVPKHDQAMARAIYGLGIEDKAIFSQLPQLTAHEKLELRLSMPREFWPQTWLDEEQ